MSYLALLRLPGAVRLAAAAFVGRIPMTMAPLAVVLLIEEATGSYAVAGSVAAGVTVSRAVVAGPWGRAADRLGYTPTLLSCATLHAASLAALVVAARSGASTAVLISCGALCGASLTSLTPCMARMWAVVIGDRPELESALALEAVTRELLVIIGPLAVGLLVAIASPDAAIVAMIVLTLAGTIAFAGSPLVRAQRGGSSHAGRGGALASPAVRTFLLAGVVVGAAMGTVLIAVPAFAEQHDASAASGALIACWAAGSLVAGLWYGRRRWLAPVERRYALSLALLPLPLLALAVAGSLPAMALLLLLAGLPMAPTNTAVYTLLNRTAPPGTATEALALYSAALMFGMTVGFLGAGHLVATAGPSWALVAGALAAALATPIVAARRASLRPAPLQGAATHA